MPKFDVANPRIVDMPDLEDMECLVVDYPDGDEVAVAHWHFVGGKERGEQHTHLRAVIGEDGTMHYFCLDCLMKEAEQQRSPI